MLDGFSDIEVFAIAKAISEDQAKLARRTIEPGLYQPDLTIRLYGTMKAGADYDQERETRRASWGIVGLALDRLSPQSREAFIRDVLALNGEPPIFKADTEAAIQSLKEPTAQSCKGKVTAHLMIARLGESHESKPTHRKSSARR